MRKTFTLISTVATLLTFTSMSFGQTEAPNLGTTAGFALFTADGALSNNGPSMITGDIGTNVGAISGFGTATINGSTRAPSSAQSMQAAADVNNAYNSLLAATCGTTIAPGLGGQTLVSTRAAGSSGVFCQTSPNPTSLNGTLTLSGNGIFIIKLNSALTTAANSQIVLTNGATANNVFFQIMGAATLGALSTFQGTIVSLGAIVLGAQASVTGRLLSTTGAITLDNNAITNVAAPDAPPAALPLLITNLAASPSPVCAGSPITFTATVGNAATPYAFTITNGSNTVIGTATGAAFSRSLTASGSGSQSFTLTVGDNGSQAMATTSVTVNALPTAGLTNNGPLTCAQTSATLTASGGVSYRFNEQSNNTGVFIVNAPGTYSVVVTGVNGCTASATTTVAGDQTALILGLSGSSTFCQGQTSQLTAEGAGSVRWNTGETTPTISVSATGTYSVTLTGANGCRASASQLVTAISCATSLCGSPASTTGIGQPLVVTGVTDQNCQTGTFRVLTTGGTGQAIDFSVIIGLSNTDPFNCVRQVDNSEQLMAINNPNSTITPFEVNGLQSGLMTNTFLFDFKAFCTGQTTTPPSSTTTAPPSSTTTTPPTPAACGSPVATLGQPLVITGVTDQNCQTGTFRILTTGGNGQPINFANNVGLSNVDPFNCVRMVDNSDMVRSINNPNSDIAPFPLRGSQVGGSTSTTFRFNFKQFCTGVARVVGAESVSELEVTVLGNPTLGETVEIVVANTANERVILQVSNPQGQPLGQLSSESTGNTVRERVRLGSSAGVYLLRVTTPTRIKTVKIVRQ